jgi:short-subunit dehydrogenase
MPTALVTGASSGIGSDLARELARDGHDLVLVARRAEPMQALAAEFKTKTTIVTSDLGKPGAAAALARELETRGLTIDVLINNAGLGAIGRFDRADPAKVSEMLYVNINALTELTRLLLPGMVERRRGRILLVASTAAFQPGPLMAVYYATKAYVLSFGEAIAFELRGTGVSVTTLCPGPTATQFADAAEMNRTMLFMSPLIKVMSSAEVARIGYRGLKAGRRVVITGAGNKLTAISSKLSPHAVVLRIANYLNSES